MIWRSGSVHLSGRGGIGFHPGRVILKALKIVPTATLLGWLPLGVRAQRSPLALGHGPYPYDVCRV